jgi:hypothetical protein
VATVNAPSAVRLPTLHQIPFGANAKRCECGRVVYMVKVDGKYLPISTAPQLETKQGTINLRALGVVDPNVSTAGMGINHFIDCPKRQQFGKRAEPTDEAVTRRIVVAAELAERFGVRCTGAPDVRDCGGLAIVAFTLRGKLFAAPCSVHASKVQAALQQHAARESRAHDLAEFLRDRGDDVARKFAAKAAQVRTWVAANGFRVPTSGRGVG